MKIQSISSIVNYQPVTRVNFARKKEEQDTKDKITTPDILNTDVIILSTKNNLEQKYDLACRLAAYYKTQYEDLLNSGKCNA